jgi:hypothetical protein
VVRAEERGLAAERLRQIADEIGLELSAERLERLLGLLESTVDGTRDAAELLEHETGPAFVPALYDEDEP